MQIFKRRPFMMCCFIFMAVAIASFFVSRAIKLIFIGLSVCAFVVVICIALSKKRKRQTKIKFFVGAFALLMAGLGAFSSFLHFDIYAADAYISDEEPITALATVISGESKSAYEESYYVYLESVNGEQIHKKAYLVFAYAAEIEEGDIVVLKGRRVPIDEVSYERSHKLSLLSDGICVALLCDDPDASPVRVAKDALPIHTFFSDLNIKLSVKLKNMINGESGSLAAALLLGNRDGLNEKTVRDFSRSGLAHLLALSGMHLTVLTAFFDIILRNLKIPKAGRCALMVPIILFYLVLTGMSLSTLRSALMLIIVYIAFLFATPYDRLTSLFVVGTIIFMVSPSSVVDIGFLMSFAAIFGVLMVSKYENDKKDNEKRSKLAIFRKTMSSIAAAFSANIAVLVLTWINFGEMSIVSPITTLVLSPIILSQLVCSLVLICFAGFSFPANVLSKICELLGDLTLRIISVISRQNWVVVSFEYDFAPYIIVALVASMLVLLTVKLKRKGLLVIPPVLFVIVYSVCVCITYNINSNSADLTYLRRGDREMLIITKNSSAVICDVSDGTYSNLAASYEIARQDGCVEVEALVLTHYHDRYRVACKRLLSKEIVRHISVPMPTNREEFMIMKALYNIASEYGVSFSVYEPGEALAVFGDGTLRVSENTFIDRSVQPIFSIEFSYGKDSVLYLTSSYSEAYGDLPPLDQNTALIFGAHGPNTKNDYFVNGADRASEIVVADEDTFVAYPAADLKDYIGKITVGCEYKRFILGDK